MTLVRNADHRGLNHLFVLVKHLFYFTRINVEAAAQDHVLHAVDYEIASVFIPIADISGMEPAILQRLFVRLRAVEIALHDVMSANTNFSALVVGESIIFLINDAHFDAPDRVADRADLPRLIRDRKT